MPCAGLNNRRRAWHSVKDTQPHDTMGWIQGYLIHFKAVTAECSLQ